MCLAQEFEKQNSRLYVVGGYCRNYLLDLTSSDIDICGSLKGDEVKEICGRLNFDCVVVNKKLGTLLISHASDRFEYTTFREENYPKGGDHSPQKVEFVTDLFVDAKRRDFTINCIYYDILGDKFVDPYGGMCDVKKRVVKCVETPEFVFSSDGLRILRLVRFSCQLGFKISRKTFKVAREQSVLLKDISAERISKELKEIVVADYKYGSKRRDTIKYINKLHILRHIFKLSYDLKLKNKGYINKFFECEKELRYKTFLMLILLQYFNYDYTNFNNLTFAINRLYGNDGIKCGIDLQTLARTYDFVQKYLFCPHTQMLFAEYHNLKGNEKNITNVFCDKVYLSQGVLALKQRNVPLNEKDLKISNETLLKNVDNKNISKIRQQLFFECFCGGVANDGDALLSRAIEIDKSLKTK